MAKEPLPNYNQKHEASNTTILRAQSDRFSSGPLFSLFFNNSPYFLYLGFEILKKALTFQILKGKLI